MIKSPKVSVVMSAYNHERYVSEAIKSVLNQTFKNFELVIVDNGSTDGTFREIKNIKDPRIRLYRFRKNQGACAAYNYCKIKSKGKYIAYLNSDDIMDSKRIHKQVAYLDMEPSIGVVFSYVQLIDDDSNLYSKKHFYSYIFNQPNRPKQDWLNYFFYNGNALCASSPMLRRECFEFVGLDDLKLVQLPDLDLWIRILFKYEIHVLPEKLLLFRIRKEEKNVSADTPESRARSMYEFSQVLKNFLKIKNISEFKKIFPNEEKKYKDIIDDELIPFYVARAALNVKHVFHKKFALDTIFELLKNKRIANKLEKVCNFNYVNFIKLTGLHDIYNVNQIINQENHIKMLENRIKELENPRGFIKNLFRKNA